MGGLGVRAIGLVALVLVAATAALASVVPAAIGWTATAANLRGANGQRFEFSCPRLAPETPLAAIRGTTVYTDDSPICVAALHTGAISHDGGTVMIEIQPGQAEYKGTQRNSVTSLSFGRHGGSYQVVAGTPTRDTIDWRTAAGAYRGRIGVQLVLFCPPIPIGFIPPTIWGTDIYTDDSPICVAAVHAGVISTTGGQITIEILPGQDSYMGSVRNRVTSQSYGTWPGSYRVTI